MSVSDLAARLTAHEHAFEGLLDLIPAKFYNPEDAANQWNKRKQTKEEAIQAKRAKLDPDQNPRRQTKGAGSVTTVPAETGSFGSKSTQTQKNTKPNGQSRDVSGRKNKQNVKNGKNAKSQTGTTTTTSAEEGAVQDGQTTGQAATKDADENSQTDVRPTKDDGPGRNITDLRAKLAAKIEALRSKRKAPGSGVEGAPTSRDAILEARRRKEDARRERKKLDKEARKDAAQEVKSEEDEDPSVPGSDVDRSDSSQDGDDDDNDQYNRGTDGVTFGKVAFSDGQHLAADGTLADSRKRKQQDTQSALQAALNKKARLSALPAERQVEIAESDAWHRALLQADGEKVKDDVGLLKKAAKRKESVKRKSSKEWKERLATIAKSKALKQKNREQNLKDRRDSKGKSGGHKKGKQIGSYQGKKGSKGSKGKPGGF